MEYFDSRGVRRTCGVSLEYDVLRMWRNHAGFDQRVSATLEPDTFEGQWQLAETPGLAGRPERDLPAPRLGLGSPSSRPAQACCLRCG